MTGIFSLEGKVAVVTGAAGGLGAPIAAGLAEAGAFVVCADSADAPNQALAQRLGAERCEAVPVDVRDEASVEALAERAAAVSGSIDVLVTCAGIGGRGPAAHYDNGTWADVIDVNLTGAFRTCRAVGRRMIAQPHGGAIVNIASVVGSVGLSGSVGYQASKGGVIQMTRTLAVEWAPHGVRVNAVSPGHVATPLVRRQWELEPELKDYFESRTPLGRLAEPVDMVGAAVFLAGPASAMVTGQILAVDGGYTAQ
jgi:NAD(P)-dependent dehydrogenase (short-subunit alcohol dehydrogenase family)